MRNNKKFIKRTSLFLVAALSTMFISTPSVFAAITIDEYGGLAADSQPHGVILGSDGNLWFAEFNSDQIGKMNPDGNLIQEYPLTPGAYPHDITTASDGKMWFTEYGHESGVGPTGAAGIGVIDTDGNVTEYPLGAGDIRPHDIIEAEPGGDLWFTKIGTHSIGRIQQDGTFLADYNFATLPGTVEPYGIAEGADGSFWITDWGTNDQIIQMALDGTILNTYPITSGYTNPYIITPGPDGNLWFTLQGSQPAIGTINPSNGQISYYDLAAGSNPQYIVAGPDGNLWFAEESAHQIGMITTSGDITEYPTPTNPSGPFGITIGPDNSVWFTEAVGNQIGRITGLTIPTPPPPPPNPDNGGGGSSTPGAPSTGFGTPTNSPLQTMALYSLVAAALFGLALGARKLATRYNK